ncbi:MFS transporter [Francisella sp. SYW-9]|uniref:MFS transporter n=1 Tax=Francisella sp. SYW-9 TaxID=2610888 RepID=UPI00123D335B|nr:MFS transporter [Francisella sp. SYW-9]
MKSLQKEYTILILMFTLIIDVMGLGLVFPIIPELTLDKSNLLLLNNNISSSTRYIFYGIIMAAWPLGLFIGSSIIGRLSDQYGRKKLLIISLLGIALSYVLSIFAIFISNIYIFILGRFIIGLFGGSFGLAQTIIIDISPKDKVARNLSFVTLSCAIGMILGPVITTVIGKIYESNSFLATILPFFIGGLVAILNLISVYLFLSETNKNKLKNSNASNWIDLIFSFRKVFLDKRVSILVISFLFMQIGWGIYIQSFPLLMSSKFSLNQAQIGLSFLCGAIGYLIAILILLPLFMKYFSLKLLVIANAIFITISLLLSSLYASVFIEYLCFTINSIFQLLFYSALLTWISMKVSNDEYGQIMGGTVSIFGVAWGINALLISGFAHMSLNFPIYIAAFSLLLSGLIVFKTIDASKVS